MTSPARDTYTPVPVDLAWQEQEGQSPVAGRCWFEYAPIRHAVQKHVASVEAWTRILDKRLVDRLTAAGGRLAAEDCRDFVKALGNQMQNSCRQPRLCRFQETEIPVFDDTRHAGPQLGGCRAVEKILFVLPSGGVAFVRVEPATTADTTVTTFLTAFLPRHVGWVAPARVVATTAARYVQRWACHYHRTGGLLPPEPDECVTEKDEVDHRAANRRWFRFISLQNWGFRRQKDGDWAWFAPTPFR